MKLNYANLDVQKMQQPVLRLQTLAGKELGVIPWAYSVKFELNYSDLSKIEFDVPRHSDGMINPVYHLLTSYKVIHTDKHGIYIIQRPTTSGDGVSEVKHITGYSVEQLFEKKNLFLEEGTYNFWNPVATQDTILGRLFELDPTWSPGTIDPKLIGRYRTFDEYNSDALSFFYGGAMDKYNCAVVFDAYAKTISAYDASAAPVTMPIYLSYDNLVDAVSLEELTDDMVTKLHLYGSDDLSINEVNPIGTDYIVDLSYFISNGEFDIVPDGCDKTLASRVAEWKAEINANQVNYVNLVSIRSSKSAQKLAQEVALNTLKGDLEILTSAQSLIVQEIAMARTNDSKNAAQSRLDAKNVEIGRKKDEITAQESGIASLQAEIDGYANSIKAIVDKLKISAYFNDAEKAILNRYLIESEVTEETFVATDIDTSASGVVSKIQGDIKIEDSKIVKAVYGANDEAGLRGKNIYDISGGKINILGATLNSDIVRGTLEIDSATGKYILTIYMGYVSYADKSFQSGMLTVSGVIKKSNGNYVINTDVQDVTVDDVTEMIGTYITLEVEQSDSFFTVNVTEYQRYSVAQELYAFGEDILAELSWPVTEFSIDTANFLFQEKFSQFTKELQFGKSVYVNIGDDGVIKPKLIGLSLDFDNPEKVSLTFSNRFQKRDVVANWLKDINKVSSSSRRFDASKYIYNRVTNKTNQVSQFMDGTLSAAANTIIGAENQSVVIDGAGIHVGSDDGMQLRIVNNMIAMSNDGWQSAKIGIGRFYSDAKTGLKDSNGNDILIGETWGVNSDLIAGKLVMGNNLVLENTTDNGVMQFKVDATGAWLNNATFVLQKDDGGSIIIDPKYGIVAGDGDLFTTSGTSVVPSFIDSDGDIVIDNDNMPTNSNFFLDIRDGSAYFRGRIKSTEGSIGGWTLADGKLYSGSGGTYVALNASATDDPLYVMWAGADSPTSASCKFYVKRDGTMFAKQGQFGGTITASNLNGNLTALSGSSSWIEGCGIKVGANSSATKGYNFYVDTSGNVWMDGSLHLKSGAITWDNLNSDVQGEIGDAYDLADSAYDLADSNRLPSYINSTYIDSTEIRSPTIKANEFNVYPSSKNGTGSYNLYGEYSKTIYHMLKINYEVGFVAPYVMFSSPAGAYASWNFSKTEFYGYCDFSSATVSGITAKFGS